MVSFLPIYLVILIVIFFLFHPNCLSYLFTSSFLFLLILFSYPIPIISIDSLLHFDPHQVLDPYSPH